MGNTYRAKQHRRKKASDGFYRSFYRWYIRSTATKRGIPFTLTLDETLRLVKMKCYICGAPPSNRFKSPNKDCWHGVEFKYNGIDRVDNKQGYVIENVKPCCRKCNVMKASMSLVEFKSSIRKIIKFGSLVKIGLRQTITLKPKVPAEVSNVNFRPENKVKERKRFRTYTRTRWILRSNE